MGVQLVNKYVLKHRRLFPQKSRQSLNGPIFSGLHNRGNKAMTSGELTIAITFPRPACFFPVISHFVKT